MPNSRLFPLLALGLLLAASAQATTITSSLTAHPYAPIGEQTHVDLLVTPNPLPGATATDLTFTYNTPPGLTFAAWDDDAFGCSTPAPGGTGTITCHTGLWQSMRLSLLFNVTPSVTPGSTINYSVTVTSTNATPASSVVTTSQTAMVLPPLTLTTNYPNNPATLVAGAPLGYDVTVTNNGTTTADDLKFSVNLFGNNAKLTSGSGPCAVSGTPTSVLCSLPALAAGASTTLHFTEITRPSSPGLYEMDAAVGEFGNSLIRVIYNYAAPEKIGDVRISGSAPAQVAVGSDFQYTLTLASDGPSASGGGFTYATPPGTTFKSMQSDGNFCTTPSSGAAGTISCSFSLSPASPWAAATTGTAVITLHATSAGTITHQASISSTSAPDPNSANNTTTSTTQVVDSPADLAITLTGDTVANSGGTAAVTITLHNNGPSTAPNVVAHLDTQVANTPGAQLPSGCSQNGQAITCTVASMASGDTVTFPMHLTFTQVENVTLKATVTSNTGDPNAQNDTAQMSVLVPLPVDLLLAASVTKTTLAAGESVPLSMLLANVGPNRAINPQITITIPGGVTATPRTSSCAPGFNQTIVCTGSNVLMPQQSDSFVVDLSASIPSTYKINLEATALSVDYNPADNTRQITLTVPGTTAAPLLGITTDPTTLNVVPAQLFTFTIKAQNSGTAAATNLDITDTLPAGTAFVSATTPAGTCSNGTPVVCHVGTLQPGASVTVTVSAMAPLSGTGTNVATIGTATVQTPLTVLATSRHRAARH